MSDFITMYKERQSISMTLLDIVSKYYNNVRMYCTCNREYIHVHVCPMYMCTVHVCVHFIFFFVALLTNKKQLWWVESSLLLLLLYVYYIIWMGDCLKAIRWSKHILSIDPDAVCAYAWLLVIIILIIIATCCIKS